VSDPHAAAPVALTSLAHGAGCGCKLPAAALLPIVRGLPAVVDPRVLVGSNTADDAGVLRLTEEIALVILRGGANVAAAAGIATVGGHSIDDPEPKYGLAVTGTVHPAELISNAGARPGDALVLTKPLGVGAITTARKRGARDDDLLARESRR
jgi:selenide,water dikinase